ncbi:MAG: phenylacetate--CoA ligase family protein [Candidatus Omnitrophica bacterium]|nr:phenylacetate--CoA ligase family protein [Candidatus Omnitrophota bacterium]
MLDRVSSYVSFLAQNSYLSLKGAAVNSIKYCKKFYNLLNELEKTDKYSFAELQNLQNEKLRRLVTHCYEFVPYYRRVFQELKLTPSDIKTKEDLLKLPLMDKNVLRQNYQDFIATNVNRRHLRDGWTTGTTGNPINALRDNHSIIFENAMKWRHRRKVGVDITDRCIAVWGTIWDDQIVPTNLKRPPFWRYNLADRQLLISYYHMSVLTLPLFMKEIERFKPQYIEGFPSSILILAKFLKARNQTYPLKAVFTSSENLYEIHRKEIEETFATKVYDLYGQSERVCVATETPQNRNLEVNMEYGVLELIHQNKPQIEGASGSIVGTGLNNYAMPLLRYETNDLAVVQEAASTGFNTPIIERLMGRESDSIKTSDGRIIPGNGIMSAFHGLKYVQESQIIQEDLEHLIIKVKLVNDEEGFNSAELIKNLKTYVGSAMNIEIKIQKDIFGSSQRKHRWVVSEIE